LQEALDAEIKRVMSEGDADGQRGELEDLMTEYSGLYSGLILEYPEIFKQQTSTDASAPVESVGNTLIQKAIVILQRTKANLLTAEQLRLNPVKKTGASNGALQRQPAGSQV